ncbi:unnamed protein product [Musa acuminata subsp. burmannicoides]
MDFFAGARVIRLRSFYQKYLVAKEDTIRVGMDQDGFSDGARWTVEIIANEQRLRFRSSWNRYLAADNNTVSQQLPDRVGVRGDWQPLAVGPHVLLRCNDADYLRAQDRHLPWRASVTLGTPSWQRSRAPFYWDVEILEAEHPPLLPPPQAAAPAPSSMAAGPSSSFAPAGPSYRSNVPTRFLTGVAEASSSSTMAATLSSPTNAAAASSATASLVPSAVIHGAAPALPTSSSYSRYEVMDREITYVVADDRGVLNEAYARNLTFTGTSTSELIRRLKKKIGTEDIYVCARNCHTRLLMPLDEELPPLYEVHNYLEVFMAVFPHRLVQTFRTATAYHIRSFHTNSYLVAEGDQLRLRLDGSSIGARWTIEVITNAGNQQRIRFRSCFGWCLSASLTWYSLQRLSRDDYAVSPRTVEVIEASRDEWLPFPVWNHFMFRCSLDDFLAAGHPLGHNTADDDPTFFLFNTLDSFMCDIHDVDPFLWNIEASEPTSPTTNDPDACEDRDEAP